MRYLLSERDYNRFQELLLWYERNKRPQPPQFRKRGPRNIGGVGKPKIFEVQSEATGDGIYNCYEQKMLNAEWDDTAGDAKFADKNTDSIEVLNLEEYDPEATYVAALSAGDMLKAWQFTDDEDITRWIGISAKSQSVNRKAYCKVNAGAGSTIVCYLDIDGTGTEITVNCNISGGSALNSAIRRLEDGNMLIVSKIGGTWYAKEGFQALDEDKGLEISSGKLAAKIDTTELQFESGAISTKLHEC